MSNKSPLLSEKTPNACWVSVAIPRPLSKFYTYELDFTLLDRAQPGVWVKVPFGKSTVVGFIVSHTFEKPAFETKKVLDIGEKETAIPESVFKLCKWVSEYYCSPLGEVLAAACPSSILNHKPIHTKSSSSSSHLPQVPFDHSVDQKLALQKIFETFSSTKRSTPILLEGVTGSGKTEVYIQAALKVLQNNESVLILVPEIALTSQLHRRFEEGLGCAVGLWHSALPDGERKRIWTSLIEGKLKVLVGVRSAIYMPIQNLGLIVVDEEHDGTYKQEERVRYHARDVAIMRGSLENASIILGSATPSLESLEKVRDQKFKHILLPHRIGTGGMPEIITLDLKKETLIDGFQSLIAEKTVHLIQEALDRNEQVIVFLNKRGFAHHLLCETCGEVSDCPNCSLSLTVHKKSNQLRCHLCDHREQIPTHCDHCRSLDLKPIGFGTESLEEEFPKLFPNHKTLRLDRDQITSHSRLEKTLSAFREGRSSILLGTQMLVKGHDFPKVTLVVVLLADALFRLPDFRASEKALQMLIQVSGRSGRGSDPGKVVIQTFQPEHMVLKVLKNETSIVDFLEQERTFRKELLYPPFARLAKIRIQQTQQKLAEKAANELGAFLNSKYANSLTSSPLEVLGPSEAFLSKLKGQYRFDLILKSTDLKTLYGAISLARQWSEKFETPIILDVDPYSLS